MAAELLLCLSKDLLNLFESSIVYDVSITVGEVQNAKVFKAHSAILTARSPYFAAAFSSNWANKENDVTIFKKPNIDPKIFGILLKYIYSGEITLSEYGVPTLLDILIAADELILEPLIEYVQDYLIEHYNDDMKQNFALLYQTVFDYNSFGKLHTFCTEIASSSPESVFKSNNFTAIKENALISLLKRDDLDMEEIDIWKCVIKWGIARIPSLQSDLQTWSQEDFVTFGKTIQQCIPLVRFFHTSSVDFYHHVKPFACILPDTLYEDLLHHYLVPDSETEKVSQLPPRSPAFYGSSITQIHHMKQIIKWIKDQDSSFATTTPEFNLLLRGSRDGFTPGDFHRLCDNKGPTVTIIKVKGNGNLIGGYCPISWHSQNISELGDHSFLFSLGDGNNTEFTLSKYSSGGGINHYKTSGPNFGKGRDLILYGQNFQSSSQSNCRRSSYSHALLDPTKKVNFAVDDYEVFQVTKN